MLKLHEFLDVAGPPSDLKAEWLQGASTGFNYLVRNSESDEIIIFTNAGQMLAHSILVSLASVTPPDGHALQYSRIDPTAHWMLEHVSGGGEPDRMYLAPPVGNYGCEALNRAEQLVFRRYFDGVDKGAMRTELSQSLAVWSG